jgi:hypothetical protein
MKSSNLSKRQAAEYTYHREFTEIVTNAKLPMQGNSMVTLQFVKGSDLRDPTRDTEKWQTLVTQLREKVTDNGGSNNVENAQALIVGMLKSRIQKDQLQPDGPARANDGGGGHSGPGAKGGNGGRGDNTRSKKTLRQDPVMDVGRKVLRTAEGRAGGGRGSPSTGGGRGGTKRVSIMLECGERPRDGCKLQKHQNPNLEGPAKSGHTNAECKVQNPGNSTANGPAANSGGGGRGGGRNGGGRGGYQIGGRTSGGRGNGTSAQPRDKGPVTKPQTQKMINAMVAKAIAKTVSEAAAKSDMEELHRLRQEKSSGASTSGAGPSNQTTQLTAMQSFHEGRKATVTQDNNGKYWLQPFQ